MKSSTRLLKLAQRHLRNSFAEELYLKTGLDFTRPVGIYASINERCNVKCLSCDYWRLPKYKDEISVEQWQDILLSLKAFIGRVQINFSGGEPFIKKGFVDLLTWCHANGIDAGVTTNGWALNEKIVDQLVDAHPLNVNISVDAPNAELHDLLRGQPGLFQKLENGVKLIREQKKRKNIEFPVMIKTLISAENFRLLPDMVNWARDVAGAPINFQPVGKWTEEAATQMWVKKEDMPEYEAVIERLIAMKRAGARIMNTELTLRESVDHFREVEITPDPNPCRISLQTLFIYPDGQAGTCNDFPRMGSLVGADAKEVWYGAQATETRKETVACTALCLNTCKSKKSFGDKVKMGLTMLRQG
jgi:MoaA/NifB/PqqE/SkfB family radical SAM enzyme